MSPQRNRWPFSLLIVSFACLAGCADEAAFWRGESRAEATTSRGGVAVIDLDAVARQIGWDTHMASDIQQRAESLNEQLEKYRAQLRQQFDDEKSAAVLETEGNQKTSQQQQARLVEIQRQLGTQLTQAQQQANEQLAAHRQTVIARVKEHVRPVAASVAAELGLATVLTKNDSVVFVYTEAVDITDRVVDRLRRSTGRPAANASSGAGESTGRVTR